MTRRFLFAFVAAGGVLVGRAIGRYGLSDTVHNCVAHPLLSLAPTLGEAIHQRTEPNDEPDEAAR